MKTISETVNPLGDQCFRLTTQSGNMLVTDFRLEPKDYVILYECDPDGYCRFEIRLRRDQASLAAAGVPQHIIDVIQRHIDSS